jgi:26S proteasome regulatory subunit N3
VGALGFRIQAQKLLVIVELLMGEIPHRSLLASKDFIKPLVPYLQVVNCVKQGEMEKFR